MNVLIGEAGQQTTYNTTRNLRFAPEVDVTGLSASIDSFEVEIKTDDEIAMGDKAWLYYESYLYAKFYITEVIRVDKYFIKIRAESELLWLDKKTMPAVMYNNELMTFVLSDVLDGTPVQVQWTNTAYNTIVVNGFLPKQTARERLIEIAFSIGAFIRCSYDGQLMFDSIDDVDTELMEKSHIFYRPTITNKSWVTSIALTYFDFGTPTGASGEETVTDANGTSYKVIRTVERITNSEVPQTAPANEVVVDSCMLVRLVNSGSVIMRLANYYFNRMEVSLDCINNRQAYKVGKKYKAYLDETTMVEGWCERCDYKQGLQTRASLKLSGSTMIQSGILTVKYVSADNPPGNIVIGTKIFVFPVGYGYEIENPWLDITISNKRYYFRPASEKTTGTMGSTSVTVTVQCYVCLIHTTNKGLLEIISVDGVSSSNNIAEID